MNKLFQNVGGAMPPRSLFNLSYEKKLTCDMGQLIPVMCDEVVPGDIFDIGASMLIRAQPMVAPPMHQVDVSAYYFFVPYRLLWSDWEDFITGGPDGDLVPTLPRWEPLNTSEVAVGSLWDYLGFPTMSSVPGSAMATLPVDFPRRAYAFIWNEFFRDETLQDPLAFDPFDGIHFITTPLLSNWEKDRFTSALLWQQRGVAPALPITGTTHAIWNAANIDVSTGAGSISYFTTGSYPHIAINSAAGKQNTLDFLNGNTVDLSTASPLDIATLRLTFQVQRWMERNARAGVRYTEFLKAHFGVNPRDDRLDRPEYIGGLKTPILFSEVLQTSETVGSPQGNMAGHGLSIAQEGIGKYRVQEFGLIMGIMRIMPKPAYQQGIDRQWLRTTKFDYYFPVFANLSEQDIMLGELYWQYNDAQNQQLFGYCGAYDEMRVKQNMVCGQFRSTFDYWHISRQFSTAPALNETFIQCNPRKDIFAAPSEPGFMVQYGNIIKALRPMPIIAEPGLIDHG